jgi:hypothetical protein
VSPIGCRRDGSLKDLAQNHLCFSSKLIRQARSVEEWFGGLTSTKVRFFLFLFFFFFSSFKKWLRASDVLEGVEIYL